MKDAKRKWAFLQALGQKGGVDYLTALCSAIDTEVTLPAEALKPMAAALRHLLGPEPETQRLAAFAKALAIKKERGRPRQEERGFWRAANYWMLRDGEGLSDAEAIAFIREKGFIIFGNAGVCRYEFREESAVRRAVREHPAAREFVRGINQDLEGGENSDE